MARLVPTGCTHLVSQSERTWFGGRDGQCVPLISATGAATDGPDAPGHDGWGMSAAPAMALICLTGAEMCECRRDAAGHDGKARPMRLNQTSVGLNGFAVKAGHRRTGLLRVTSKRRRGAGWQLAKETSDDTVAHTNDRGHEDRRADVWNSGYLSGWRPPSGCVLRPFAG